MSQQFFVKFPISNFIKIFEAVLELVHANRWIYEFAEQN
jgi:hypothetical protein